jgi:hypothetical protein
MILKKEVAGNSSAFAFGNIHQTARRAIRLFVFLLVGIVIFSSAVKTAEARIFTVTKVTDSDDNMCDADCSFREALGRANSEITNDVINFAPGLFSTPQTIVYPFTVTVDNGFGALTIDGPGANLLTLTRPAGSVGRIIYVDQAVFTLNGVTITGGNMTGLSLQGGAIVLGGNGILTINNCVVTGNSSDSGGGIAVSAGLTVINNTTVSNNTAKFIGGGLYVTTGLNPTTVRINNSTFSGNKVTEASSGSGGAGIASIGGTTTLTNSTISGNQVNPGINAPPGIGGGILNLSGTINLINVTVAENYARTGGGVYNQTTNSVFARNSLFGNNFGDTKPDFSGRLDSQGYNLLESMPTTIFGDQIGNIYLQDPQIGALANNGGVTLTHALNPTSPAVDAADPSNFPRVDQRGLARPADGNGDDVRRADIGSFERNAVPPYRYFDFDGDGKADVSVYRPADGVWYLLRSAQGFTGVQFGIASDRIVPADYDGDGKTDIAVYRPAEGNWYLLQSSAGFSAFQFGTSEDIPVPADYDGDGKANLAVFRPSTSSWYVARPTGVPAQNFDTYPFGVSGDKPVSGGDFDGDGKADVTVFRPSNGFWYRVNSSNGQFVATQFGIAEDKPVAADYDGDGKTDIAVFRPSDSVWYILQSINGVFNPVQFGASGDVPVPADYDGDGRANIAVFRPSTNSWYIGRAFGAPSQNFDSVQFGVGTDKPVPAAFIP